MKTTNPLAFVINAYRGARIRRLHTEFVLGESSVGRHSWGVAMLCDVLTEGKASGELLRKALYHDIAEQYTGDVPAPVKWAAPSIAAMLGDMENRFEQKMDIVTSMADSEFWVFSVADMLDLCFFCYEQHLQGNKTVAPIFKRGYRYLEELLARTIDYPSHIEKPREIARNLLSAMRSSYQLGDDLFDCVEINYGGGTSGIR